METHTVVTIFSFCTFQIVDSAEIVNETSGVKIVQSRETSEANGIVVVAVNAKNGEPDVHVGVGIVDLAIVAVAVREVDVWITHELDGDRTVAQDVLAKDGETFFLGQTRRLVLVKEITGEQNHVNP
jgi:hypothetical protein